MSPSSASRRPCAWSWFVWRGGAAGFYLGIVLALAWYAYLVLSGEPGTCYGALWLLVPIPPVGAAAGALTGGLVGAVRGLRQRG